MAQSHEIELQSFFNSHSGASIDNFARRNNVTILETDQAYGLLQFMPGGVLPQTNDPLIPPAESMPRVQE